MEDPELECFSADLASAFSSMDAAGDPGEAAESWGSSRAAPS